MPHPTLTARWSNVVVATWAVPPAALAKFIPAAPAAGGLGALPLELDLFGKAPLMLGDGRPGAAVSLVAQQCSHVRIMGVKWPYLSRFSAMYLRICVKQGLHRGVVYLREIVPNRVIAWGARKTYNQPCVSAPVLDEVKQQTLLIGAEYRVHWPEGGLPPGGHVTKEMRLTEHMVRVVGRKPGVRAGADSLEVWLTDRPFVFGLSQSGVPLVYEVIHPTWGIHPAVEAAARIDFASMFSPDLGFLNGRQPNHAMLAAGSDAAIFPKRESAGVRWGVKRERGKGAGG